MKFNNYFKPSLGFLSGYHSMMDIEGFCLFLSDAPSMVVIDDDHLVIVNERGDKVLTLSVIRKESEYFQKPGSNAVFFWELSDNYGKVLVEKHLEKHIDDDFCLATAVKPFLKKVGERKERKMSGWSEFGFLAGCFSFAIIVIFLMFSFSYAIKNKGLESAYSETLIQDTRPQQKVLVQPLPLLIQKSSALTPEEKNDAMKYEVSPVSVDAPQKGDIDASPVVAAASPLSVPPVPPMSPVFSSSSIDPIPAVPPIVHDVGVTPTGTDAQSLQKNIEAIKAAVLAGQPVTPEMLKDLPPSLAEKLISLGVFDAWKSADALQRKIPNAVTAAPVEDHIPASPPKGGSVMLPLPGGGDMRTPDDMRSFGLDPDIKK